jgi:hypothetical protein
MTCRQWLWRWLWRQYAFLKSMFIYTRRDRHLGMDTEYAGGDYSDEDYYWNYGSPTATMDRMRELLIDELFEVCRSHSPSMERIRQLMNDDPDFVKFRSIHFSLSPGDLPLHMACCAFEHGGGSLELVRYVMKNCRCNMHASSRRPLQSFKSWLSSDQNQSKLPTIVETCHCILHAVSGSHWQSFSTWLSSVQNQSKLSVILDTCHCMLKAVHSRNWQSFST